MRRILACGLAAALLALGLVASPAQAATPASCPESHPTGTVTSVTNGSAHVLTVRLTYTAAQAAASQACGPYLKFQASIANYGVTDDAYVINSTDFTFWTKNKTIGLQTFAPGLAGVYTAGLTARSYTTVLTWTGGANGVPFAFYIQVGNGPTGLFGANLCRNVPNPCSSRDVYNATNGTVGGGVFNF